MIHETKKQRAKAISKEEQRHHKLRDALEEYESAYSKLKKSLKKWEKSATRTNNFRSYEEFNESFTLQDDFGLWSHPYSVWDVEEIERSKRIVVRTEDSDDGKLRGDLYLNLCKVRKSFNKDKTLVVKNSSDLYRCINVLKDIAGDVQRIGRGIRRKEANKVYEEVA